MNLSRTLLLFLVTVGCTERSQGKLHGLPGNLRGKPVPEPNPKPDPKPVPPSPTLELASQQRPGYEEVSIYDGVWGGWTGWKGIESGGYYVCGGRMRFEDPIDGDDTAANGLKLQYCHMTNWYSQKTEEISSGYWGAWKDMKKCPFNSYVDGAQVRFEDPIGGGDDTALNGLKLRCRDKDSGTLKWISVYDGVWGGWKAQAVKGNKYAKLANMRIEAPIDGDDTAWNGLKFQFETPNTGTSLATPSGYWNNEAAGPTIKYSITESIESSSGQELTEEESASISVTLEAGFEFEGIGASVSVTGEQARSVARTVSSTITRSQAITIEATCPGTSSTGRWVLWQWYMNQEADATGVGFEMHSNQYVCTDHANKMPKCPIGSCNDAQCQECGSGSSHCTDKAGWYDSDGPTYNCDWYKESDRCARYGNGYENFGFTANEACCACGGGNSGAATLEQ